MENIIIIAVLAAIFGAAIRYLYKAKKNGAVCVGCPSGGCGGCCNCGKEADKTCSCDGACHNH